MALIKNEKRIVRARKEHECIRCEGPIRPGDQYLLVDVAYTGEDGFNSEISRKCIDCHDRIRAGDLIGFCERNGAETKHKNMSYYVGCHLVPESHVKVKTESDEIKLSWSAGLGPNMEGFANWINQNPDLPDVPDIWMDPELYKPVGGEPT